MYLSTLLSLWVLFLLIRCGGAVQVKECNSGSSSLSGSEIMERLREVLITAQNALEGQSDEAEDDDM